MDDRDAHDRSATSDSDAAPTAPEVACFEAGIKFGSLYHQFAGTPVSPASAPRLARAMEAAIENQPHCETVAVTIHDDRLDTAHGYTELTGRHMDVTMEIAYEDVRVTTRMAVQDGYPLMRVEHIDRDATED